jgi:hypothetical protein
VRTVVIITKYLPVTEDLSGAWSIQHTLTCHKNISLSFIQYDHYIYVLFNIFCLRLVYSRLGHS